MCFLSYSLNMTRIKIFSAHCNSKPFMPSNYQKFWYSVINSAILQSPPLLRPLAFFRYIVRSLAMPSHFVLLLWKLFLPCLFKHFLINSCCDLFTAEPLLFRRPRDSLLFIRYLLYSCRYFCFCHFSIIRFPQPVYITPRFHFSASRLVLALLLLFL